MSLHRQRDVSSCDNMRRHLCRVSLLLLLGLLPVTGTLDHGAEITNGDLEGEVQGSEHDGKEDPPATHVGDECKCAGGDETLGCSSSMCSPRSRCGRITVGDGKVPVCTSQAAESKDEGEEDQGKDDVGSE